MSQWLRIPSRRRATAWRESPTAFVDHSFGPLRPSTIYRYVMGIDSQPAVMPQVEVEKLGDPLAAILRQGKFPLTAQEVLSALDAAGGLPEQKSYLISEAGQIPPDKFPSMQRDPRWTVVRGQASRVDLLISTGATGDPASTFLQIAAWDETAGLFNYYMRLPPTWVWAGNSYSALAPGSRGNGCFDSHVNGSVVMKELKSPWMNWQSMKATILLAADDPIRQSPLFPPKGAEDFEGIIRATVSRWTQARLERAVSQGLVENVDWLFRQICTTTSVNLTSTDIESAAVAQDPSISLTLPLGFWLNGDVLLDSLGIPAQFVPPTVTGGLYLDSLHDYDFALVEGEHFRQPGDSFFAFVVPEAALEDNEVIAQMVRTEIISPHLAASILMVDFPNPVFSPARARLLAHIPASAKLDSTGGGLSDEIAADIISAASSLPSDAAEHAFRVNWQLPHSEWPQVFATQIEDYMAAVNRRITTSQGFDDYLRLAESRRREFRRMRLNEFSLTLPSTNVPATASLLQMNSNGTIREKQA
jgi:hypothetical protein